MRPNFANTNRKLTKQFVSCWIVLMAALAMTKVASGQSNSDGGAIVPVFARIFGSTLQATIHTSSTQFLQISDQVNLVASDAAPNIGWNGWATGHLVSSDVWATGSAPSLEYTGGGGHFGVGRAVSGSTNVGFFGGHAQHIVEGQTTYEAFMVGPFSSNQSTTVTSALAGAYIRYEDIAGNYFLATVGRGSHSMDSMRMTATGNALGSNRAIQWSATVERGWSLQLGSISIRPTAAIQVIGLQSTAFLESGATNDMDNLEIFDANNDSLRGIFGMRASRDFALGIVVISPEIRIRWMHEFFATNAEVNFAKSPTPGFVGTRSMGVIRPTTVSQGVSLGRDWVFLGVGTKIRIGQRLSLFVNYETQLSQRLLAHNGSGGFQCTW